MKNIKLQLWLCIVVSCIVNVSQSIAQNQIDFKHTIECLNNKIVSYNVGVTQLDLIKEADTVRYNIDSINSIITKSFEANNNYNKLNIKLNLDYYYSDDVETVKKLEKYLIDLHYIEIKKLETERIVRLENLIICIRLSNKFEGSFLYLKNILFNLTLDYINHCKM